MLVSVFTVFIAIAHKPDWSILCSAIILSPKYPWGSGYYTLKWVDPPIILGAAALDYSRASAH